MHQNFVFSSIDLEILIQNSVRTIKWFEHLKILRKVLTESEICCTKTSIIIIHKYFIKIGNVLYTNEGYLDVHPDTIIHFSLLNYFASFGKSGWKPHWIVQQIRTFEISMRKRFWSEIILNNFYFIRKNRQQWVVSVIRWLLFKTIKDSVWRWPVQW